MFNTELPLRATKNPFYLHVGRDILYNLNNHTKAVCGYATVHDVQVSAIKLVFSCISERVILILRIRVWRTDRKASSYQRLSRCEGSTCERVRGYMYNCTG